MQPEELKYTDTHEWVYLDRSTGEPIAIIGLTEQAVTQLTDLVYIDLPKVGDLIHAGKEFGTVESVKAVSSLHSPVSGEVVAVNSALSQDLDLLSRDPYGVGWLIKVKVRDESELARLLDYAAYRRRCVGE
ncbi:glycine cleavage system protein GcvH [Methylothermus subterraneus]